MADTVDTSADLAFYRQGMRIDPAELVRECSAQPMNHAKIARQAVLAASRLSAMDLRVSRDFGRRAAAARKELAKVHTGRIPDISKMVDLWIAGLLTPDSPQMSTRGQRAQEFNETNGAPPPPTPLVSSFDKAQRSNEYREGAIAKSAMTAARENTPIVLPEPTRASQPKPTTRKRETLD